MAQGVHVVEGNTREAIQLVIDRASGEGGGVVFLPARLGPTGPIPYTLDGAIELKSNVSLIGAGDQTVLRMEDGLSDASNVNFIELVGETGKGIHDIKISNLAIEGPGVSKDLSQGASAEARQGCGILALDQPVHNVVVEACRIENVSGCGIYFRTTTGDPIKNVTIRDCRLLQNRVPSEDKNPNSYKDIFFNARFFENICVEGNVCSFTPNGTSTYGNDSGISFVITSGKGYVRNVRFVGNVCSGHRRHGLITSYAEMENDGVFVSNNRCENNGWVGIYVNTKDKFNQNAGLVIQGNICNYNGFRGFLNPQRTDGTIRAGIVLIEPHHAIISNNICMNNGQPGGDFVDKVTIDAAATNASGIRIRGKEVIVEGNLVKGNEDSGVVMWPGLVSRVSIVNNRALQNGKHGVEVAGVPGGKAKQVVVTGNMCADNGGNGIRVSATDGALVASNYVSNNGGLGIELDGRTENVSVDGNFVQAKDGQSAIKMGTGRNFKGANQPLTG